MHIIYRRHRAVFERLGEYGSRRFLVDPIDLPFAFLLMPRADDPQVHMVRSGEEPNADVAIHGSFGTLIALLEGRVDGDALFFSRDLTVEGDTEALLALRNAVDGEGIDLLEDFVMSLGPLAPMGVRLADIGRTFTAHLADRAGSVVASLLGPLDRRLAAQARTLDEVKVRLERIEQRMARKRT
ncbi:MAG: SCP2 sterol-binding domain-containing protein [Rhodospirillales bacterium]|nr:SCP2 sterol-binding domain-containing protein [Rhodospirillales bacterium]